MVYDKCEHRRFNLSHLGGGIFFSDIFVEPPQASPEGGVEVIFDIVVCAAW